MADETGTQDGPDGPPSPAQLAGAVFAQGVPHNAALGIEVLEYGDGRTVTRLPYKRELVGNPMTGVLHGGVVTSLIDATAGAAIFAAMQQRRPIATLDLRIDYLRPARPGAALVCEATCDKITRNVAFARAVAHDGDPDDPVATSSSTFMVFDARRPTRAPPSTGDAEGPNS